MVWPKFCCPCGCSSEGFSKEHLIFMNMLKSWIRNISDLVLCENVLKCFRFRTKGSGSSGSAGEPELLHMLDFSFKWVQRQNCVFLPPQSGVRCRFLVEELPVGLPSGAHHTDAARRWWSSAGGLWEVCERSSGVSVPPFGFSFFTWVLFTWRSSSGSKFKIHLLI